MSEEISNTDVYIKVYVGTEEETFTDHLGVDLVVAGREITLYTSTAEMEGCTQNQILDELGLALNEAILFSKKLGLPIVVDEEEIASLDEDSDTFVKKISKLLKEVL